MKIERSLVFHFRPKRVEFINHRMVFWFFWVFTFRKSQPDYVKNFRETIVKNNLIIL